MCKHCLLLDMIASGNEPRSLKPAMVKKNVSRSSSFINEKSPSVAVTSHKIFVNFNRSPSLSSVLENWEVQNL